MMSTEEHLGQNPNGSVLLEQAPQIQPSTFGLRPEDLSLPEHLIDEELIRELSSIPDRLGFKIGEVAELLNVRPYILRYWESEFVELKPKKANNNQRYYTRREVEMAFLIRKLLYRDKYSIEGARSALKSGKKVFREQVDTLNEKRGKITLLLQQGQKILEELKGAHDWLERVRVRES
ncbi:MAG: MerR family transcriptional regulator [Bdellovibrionaceae bacterium]|nr:MerR family transcriptional regulator [Pseudobdellovibrionaceae bacterium]MDW8190702.1 MerR family transcriptional regulator [Pseudobdellovibrionaceae bacterium]